MNQWDKNLAHDQGIKLTLFSKTDDTPANFGTVDLPRSASSLVSKNALHTLVISGLTVETFAVTGSTDGTNFSAALIPLDYTPSTGKGGYAAAATLGNGTYKFPATWNFSSYNFTKSSTTELATVAFAAVTMAK